MPDATDEHPKLREHYLSDGCYASHVGGIITLRSPKLFGDHKITLSADLLAHFLEYVERVKKGEL